MVYPRPEAVLPYLPSVGQRLAAVPGDDRRTTGRVVWRSGNHTWLAPVLECGLVAWSRSRPGEGLLAHVPEAVTPWLTAQLDRPLDSPPYYANQLPEPGQPMVVNLDFGIVVWQWRDELTQARLDRTGLIDWGSAVPVVPPDTDPDELTAIYDAEWTLRQADPGGARTTTLTLPERDGQARDITVAGNWIASHPRVAGLTDARLRLRTEGGHRRHIIDAVVLDQHMVLPLAAEVAAYPGATDDESEEPPTLVVQHPEPYRTNRSETIWKVDEDLAVLHHLMAPLSVWLHCRGKHPLTEDRALRLAGALAAANARLDRVCGLAVRAAQDDHDRHTDVSAEADFAAVLRRAIEGDV